MECLLEMGTCGINGRNDVLFCISCYHFLPLEGGEVVGGSCGKVRVCLKVSKWFVARGQ